MPEFEPNFLRKTYRITLPAKVIIGGKEYEIVDWSFEGFGIKKSPEDTFDKNSEHAITFVLPFLGFEVSFKAKATKLKFCTTLVLGTQAFTRKPPFLIEEFTPNTC